MSPQFSSGSTIIPANRNLSPVSSRYFVFGECFNSQSKPTDRAAELDPAINTSVAHTFFLAGE
jgi:hypothetical protein